MRRACALLGVVVLLLGSFAFGLVASPSYAATRYAGTPDPGGFYAHCNYNSKRVGGATSSNKGIACVYGMNNATTGSVVAGAVITSLSITYHISAATSNCNAGSIPNDDIETFSSTGTNPATVDGLGIAQWSLSSGTDCTGSMTISATACTVTISGGVVTNGSCKIDNLAFSSGVPSTPSSFYPGGTSGSSVPSLCFTSSPDSPAPNVSVAFDAGCTKNAPEAAGAVYSWAFTGSPTDTDTSGVTGAATWVIEDTYTVTLTVVYGGHTYTYAQTVVIASAGGGDCPSGWGFLNPTAVVKVLQCLFVPSTSLSSEFSTLGTAFSTHWPVAPVSWMVSLITGPTSTLMFYASNPSYASCSGPPASACSISFDFPLNAGTGGTDSIHIPVFSGNPDNAANAHLGDVMALSVWLSRLMALVFVVGAARNLFRFAMHGDPPPVGSDGPTGSPLSDGFTTTPGGFT